jgi:hypothetical protein
MKKSTFFAALAAIVITKGLLFGLANAAEPGPDHGKLRAVVVLKVCGEVRALQLIYLNRLDILRVGEGSRSDDAGIVSLAELFLQEPKATPSAEYELQKGCVRT